MYGLSGDDLTLLKEMVDWYRNQPQNVRNRPAPDESEQTTPEVYVAKTPGGGIPAISGDTPGTASCQLYRRNKADGALDAFGSRSKTVNNITTTDIPGSIYVPVSKDKFNDWYVLAVGDKDTPGTGTGTGPISQLVLTDFNPGTCVFTQKTFLFHHDGRLASIT